MGGWIAAAVIAVVAAIVIWRLRAAREAVSAEVEETRSTMHRAQEQLDAQADAAALGRMLADLGDLLEQPRPAPELPSDVFAMLTDYRTRVHEYDAAVQYCLQPVELMPGADEDDLDRLMEHVSGARKRLFQARISLVENDMLQKLPSMLDHAAEEQADTGAAALATVTRAVRALTPLDPAPLIAAAAHLSRLRHRQGPDLLCDLGELPILAPAPWLAPALLELLHLGLAACEVQEPARLSAHAAGREVILVFSGTRRHAPGSADSEALELRLEALQQRLDERGVNLNLQLDEPRKLGFSMALRAPGESGES